MVRLFFDTETTGLPKDYNAPSSDLENWDACRLVQLSWIMQDEKQEVLSKGNFIVRPEGFEIPEESSAIHGITTERALAEGVELRKVTYFFLGAARMADLIIGHNVSYDMNVMGAELIRTWGKDWIQDIPVADTMHDSVDFCAIPSPGRRKGYKWPRLMELYVKLFGKEFQDAHDSSADIAATAECYWELKARGIML